MTEAERITPADPAATLAVDMVRSLVQLGDTIKSSIVLQAELKDSIDQLIGHCEVFGRAMEIVAEKKEEGKVKWTLADFAESYLEAADEIMPAEGEEGEEEEEEDDGR